MRAASWKAARTNNCFRPAVSTRNSINLQFRPEEIRDKAVAAVNG